MDPPKSNNPKISTANKQLNLHEAFTTLQTHCSHFLQNLCSFPTHTQSPLNSFNFSLNPSSSSAKIPCWAQISTTQSEKYLKLGAAMSNEAIEERLAGVPVYALSNFNEEFVLVSGASTGKSLGLFCFKKEDADTLLHQMKTMDPGMRKEGSKVVAVALNKVFQLKVGGVAFRLIPESDQVKNALKDMRTGTMIGGGREAGGLYHVDRTATAVANVAAPCGDAYSDHYHFGHSSAQTLEMLLGLSMSANTFDCNACQLGKHHRASDPSCVQSLVLTSFEIVHSDVWGVY